MRSQCAGGNDAARAHSEAKAVRAGAGAADVLTEEQRSVQVWVGKGMGTLSFSLLSYNYTGRTNELYL